MKHEFLRKSSSVILFFVAIFIWSLPVFSQQDNKTTAPLVILTALSSPPGDTVAGTLASTMTSSIELMLNLTGRVTLRRADFLIPTVSLDRSIPYYYEHKAAEAVYGSVTPTNNGEYAIELDVWNASKPNAKPNVVKRTISNVLSSFAIGDEMTLKIASTIVGRKLEEGTLVVQNVSSLPKFSIYANSHLLGRNQSSFRILTGSWTIVVAKPGEVGDVAVQTFHVDIKRGKTATVVMSQVAPRDAAVVNKGTVPQSAQPTLSKNTGVSNANEPTPVLKVRHATGSISVSTATAGTLYVDGQMMGHIPAGRATLSSVAVGIRDLAIRYVDGHVAQEAIMVREGTTTNATFSYRRATSGSHWTKHVLPTSQMWSSVTYGNGAFVAVADYSNNVAISSDGLNWTEGSLPSSQGWSSVTYGNGTFLAVASNSSVVATSSDGIHWTKGSLPTSEDWPSVTYGNGIFVAVASDSNVVATSSNAIDWNESPLPGNLNWSLVTYGNGTFLAVASNSSVVATSSDGINWTRGSLPTSEDWQSVTYGNGTFVVIANGLFGTNVAAASSDGISWTKGSLPSSEYNNTYWHALTYGKGTFVAFVWNSNLVATSSDGLNWTESFLPSSEDWSSVTYGNGTFVAVVWNSSVVATSP